MKRDTPLTSTSVSVKSMTRMAKYTRPGTDVLPNESEPLRRATRVRE